MSLLNVNDIVEVVEYEYIRRIVRLNNSFILLKNKWF